MNNKTLLVIASILIGIGLIKPNLDNFSLPWNNKNDVINRTTIDRPKDNNLLDKTARIIEALQSHKDRKIDGVKLANLYNDLAILIELDAENEVIKTTEEIRQANSLAGLMLKLNIKDKYPNLAKANQDLIVAAIGDDSVTLDANLRKSAVEGFRALAWACNEGSK